MHYRDPEIQDRIENLFSTMAVSSRITTAQTIAHDYISESVHGDDFALAELLLAYLIRDVEEDVRHAVAEQVKSYPNLPKKLALPLAMDIDRISVPILKYSGALDESDLLEILKTAGETRQIAIAKREGISRKVTSRIAEKGCYEAIHTCLKNKTADISDDGFNHIIIRYPSDTGIHELMIRRPDLQDKTVSRLCLILSEELRSRLFDHYDIPESISERILENAREETLAQKVGKRASLVEKQKITRQLEADGRLTATLLLRILIQGDFTFFSAGLAQISGISIKRVTVLVSDRGNLGLKRLYERADLPAYLYPAFKAALQELTKMASLNPRINPAGRQQKIINSIARIYNYEEDLELDSLMEKLLPMKTDTFH